MGKGAEIFESMAFLLKRIFSGTVALHLDAGCLNFKRLFGIRCEGNDTCDNQGSTDINLSDSGEVLHLICVYDLYRGEDGSVIYREKAKGLGIPIAFDPAAQCDFLIGKGFCLFF